MKKGAVQFYLTAVMYTKSVEYVLRNNSCLTAYVTDVPDVN